MASFLQNILKKVPNSSGYVRDSLHLVNELKDIVLPEEHILVSFDVKSLFTNIPRDLVVESIKKRFPSLGSATKLTLNEIIASTLFVMNSTSFGFNGQFFEQVYGTAMGSHISPIVADFVTTDLEDNCLNKLSFKPSYLNSIYRC